MAPREAALAARRAFGNPTQLRDEVRDDWGGRGLEHAGADIRYAWRSFRRAPGFAITVILTIALALGLNTMAFTIFNAYVLRPLAVRDPSSLYQITWRDRRGASVATESRCFVSKNPSHGSLRRKARRRPTLPSRK